jgi:predicted GNAT superfamily acetyltransferase
VPFEWEDNGRHFIIRDAQGDAELHTIEDLQREVWGFSELDIVPHATLIATTFAGGITLGAFEGERMIGFAYGFPSHEGGRMAIHSHMLAVKPEYRNASVGFNLKLAQRQRAIEMGIEEISWTFDPLQSLNAHLNFGKLGVTSRRYIVNFYGEHTSSPLHQGFGTDRLWVSWSLNSQRVRDRMKGERSSPAPDELTGDREPLLVCQEGGRPATKNSGIGKDQRRHLIEIPHDIPTLKERDPQLAADWRAATRQAFLSAIDAGFVVSDFVRLAANEKNRWFYVLTRD